MNAVVLWNTRYMDASLKQLPSDGWEVRPEDVQHVSPLSHEHINLHGRYHFGLPEEVQQGELRKSRDPNEREVL